MFDFTVTSEKHTKFQNYWLKGEDAGSFIHGSCAPISWGLFLMALTSPNFSALCVVCTYWASVDSGKARKVFHMELSATAKAEIRDEWRRCDLRLQRHP